MRPLLLVLLCVGCSAPVADYSGQFVPVIAVACGVATVGDAATPDVPAFKCATCEDKGRLPIRDTGRFEDCPDCEINPPLSPPAEPHEADAGHDAPVVEWLTLEEAQATGRPIFVFQHYADPKADDACKPCHKLRKLLDEPDVIAFLAERGVCVSDTVERWQARVPVEKQTAPAIALVLPGAAEGDTVEAITGYSPDNPKGFRLESADAFLTDLTEWINALSE